MSNDSPIEWDRYKYHECPEPLPSWFSFDNSDEIVFRGMQFSTDLKLWAAMIAWIHHDLVETGDDQALASFQDTLLQMLGWVTELCTSTHQGLADYIRSAEHLVNDARFFIQLERDEEATEFVAKIALLASG